MPKSNEYDLSVGGIKIEVVDDWEYGIALFFSTDGQHYFLNESDLSVVVKALNQAQKLLKKKIQDGKIKVKKTKNSKR